MSEQAAQPDRGSQPPNSSAQSKGQKTQSEIDTVFTLFGTFIAVSTAAVPFVAAALLEGPMTDGLMHLGSYGNWIGGIVSILCASVLLFYFTNRDDYGTNLNRKSESKKTLRRAIIGATCVLVAAILAKAVEGGGAYQFWFERLSIEDHSWLKIPDPGSTSSAESSDIGYFGDFVIIALYATGFLLLVRSFMVFTLIEYNRLGQRSSR